MVSSGRAALAVSFAVTAAILVLHYGSSPTAGNVHDLLRRLLYLPVVTASIAAGARGGVLLAAIASVSYLPHVRQLSAVGQPALDHVLELMLLLIVAALVGGFADASRRARRSAAEQARMAAWGEIGMNVVTQVDGPLAAIEGQIETLHFLNRDHGQAAMQFSIEAVEREVARARRFLADLRGLAQRAEHRITAVELTALVGGVVGDLNDSTRQMPRAGAPVRMSCGAEAATVRANRAVLAYAVRALLQGLSSALPASGRLAVSVETAGKGVQIVVAADAGRSELGDLRQQLMQVFGPAADEYRFDQALCLRLLASEGVAVEFSQPAPGLGLVTLGFGSARQVNA